MPIQLIASLIWATTTVFWGYRHSGSPQPSNKRAARGLLPWTAIQTQRACTEQTADSGVLQSHWQHHRATDLPVHQPNRIYLVSLRLQKLICFYVFKAVNTNGWTHFKQSHQLQLYIPALLPYCVLRTTCLIHDRFVDVFSTSKKNNKYALISCLYYKINGKPEILFK